MISRSCWPCEQSWCCESCDPSVSSSPGSRSLSSCYRELSGSPTVLGSRGHRSSMWKPASSASLTSVVYSEQTLQNDRVLIIEWRNFIYVLVDLLLSGYFKEMYLILHTYTLILLIINIWFFIEKLIIDLNTLVITWHLSEIWQGWLVDIC